MSSMIHSARPKVTPVANIVFCCVLLDLKSGEGRTDIRTNGRTTCAKTMIPTGRDCGLAEWINIYSIDLKPVGLIHAYLMRRF